MKVVAAIVLLAIIGTVLADDDEYRHGDDTEIPKNVKMSAFPNKVKGATMVNVTYVAKMSPIKNQKTCRGGSATMAALAVLEYWAIKNNTKNKIFSDQAVIDCMVNTTGCKFAHPYYSFSYASKFGVPDGTKYIWKGRQGTCMNKTYPAVYTMPKICGASLGGNDANLASIISNYGPNVVLMATNGTNFDSYKTGVWNETSAARVFDTAVVVVGYGSDANHGDYWIIRNSKGTRWGQNGYGKVARGRNVCGIATTVWGPC